MYKSNFLNKILELSEGLLEDIVHIDLHRISQIDTKVIAYDSNGNCFKIIVLTSLLTKDAVYGAFEEIYAEDNILNMIKKGKNKIKKPFRHFLEVNMDSDNLATVPVPKKVSDKVFEVISSQAKFEESIQGDFTVCDFKSIGLRFVKITSNNEIVMVIFYDHLTRASQQIFYIADIDEVPLEALRELKKDLKNLYVTEL